MSEVRNVTVTIEETVFGFHIVKADGDAMSNCYVASRSSEIAFGQACAAASFGEFFSPEWSVGNDAPWACGLDRAKVVSRMRENEKAWQLYLNGVTPGLAEEAASFRQAWVDNEKAPLTQEVLSHFLLYVVGWDDDEHTEKLYAEMTRLGWMS